MARKINKNSSTKLASRNKRRTRIRGKIFGTSERPRLCVFRGNRSFTAQLINDNSGKTLASVASEAKKTANRDIALDLGKQMAAKAKAAGVTNCVFDRSGYAFHGRISSFAEGARQGGLNF